MKYLLSFAIGAILGDIFFHLIPESLQSLVVELNDTYQNAHKKIGLSVIAGIFMFIIVEMVLEKWSNSIKEGRSTTTIEEVENFSNKEHEQHIIDQPNLIFNNKDLNQALEPILKYDNPKVILENNNNLTFDLNAFKLNNDHDCDLAVKSGTFIDEFPSLLTEHQPRFRKNGVNEKKVASNTQSFAEPVCSTQIGTTNRVGQLKEQEKVQECRIIEIAGYLNLIANGFDNFTHGLAIGASFLAGSKVGVLTTFVIFIHEIPHEICDYAILVNSGFSRWDAVKAQSSVSLFGLLGTATALYVKSVHTLNAYTVWILPFSAGGFLYIALVNLLPEILDRKTSVYRSFVQIACVILGIAFMAAVAVI